MVLDNVRVIDEEKKIKQDERVSRNSIPFRQQSFDNALKRVKKLEAAKDEAMKMAEEVAATVTVENEETVKEEVKNYALLIANLEQNINILNGMQGPIEKVESRAIRLTDKMIAAAKDNSKGIYKELGNSEIESENFTPVEIIPDSIDIQEISKENAEPIKESIEEAIEDESLTEEDIKNIFDNNLGISEEKTDVVEIAKDVIDRDEIERKVNEKISKSDDFNKFFGVTDEEYVPMTDEEIVKSQENIELDKADVVEDKAVREDIEVVPERKEVVEEKIEEFTTKVEPIEEVVEARTITMTSEEKAKAHEMLEKVRAARMRKEELEKESSSVDSDIETQKEINAKAVAEENEAKRSLEESSAEAKQAEETYLNAIKAMEQELEALNNETDAISNGIRVKKEELAGLEEDTANRNKEIENLGKETTIKQEEIAKFKELAAMLDGSMEYAQANANDQKTK